MSMEFFGGGVTTASVALSSEPAEVLSSDNTRYYTVLGVGRGAGAKELSEVGRCRLTLG